MITEFTRISIENYIIENGVGLDEFCGHVRAFFVDSRDHYKRRLLIDKIIENLEFEINMENLNDRKQFFYEIKRGENIKNFFMYGLMKKLLNSFRTTVDRWSEGYIDPPLISLLNYCDNVGLDLNDERLWTSVEQTRFAVARTLEFLRIYPWPIDPRPWINTMKMRWRRFESVRILN